MIDSFNLITDTFSLTVDLDTGKGIYDINADDLVKKYFNSGTKGISWTANGQFYSILETRKKIIGYPTVDRSKIVAIYPLAHDSFGAPGNAIILDSQGVMERRLQVPKLTSPTAKERRERMKYDISDDASFRFVGWGNDSGGNAVTIMQIDFDWEWWESRVLNPETGEFGECISSGRR